ncbi:MAG: hypothetical protein V4687_03055 [Bacteroidota bacterium]
MPAETSNTIFKNITKEAQGEQLSKPTEKARKIQPLWRYAAAIVAAIALIVTGFYFFKPVENTTSPDTN